MIDYVYVVVLAILTCSPLLLYNLLMDRIVLLFGELCIVVGSVFLQISVDRFYYLLSQCLVEARFDLSLLMVEAPLFV